LLNTPFSPWPSFTEEESVAVCNCLLSNRVNYWTGYECRDFEKEFAVYADCEYAVALANGTLALDVALKVLSIGVGDEVVVTPRTFIASVSCVVNAGATPVFADVEPDSGNISAATIQKMLTSKTKAIICVHLAGWPCDMDEIMALAGMHNLFVIEDCAQAHGGQYRGRSLGAIGHIGVWSFCQDKIMTTGGEGGMVTTNDYELWSKVWSYKDHGKSWEAVYEYEHPVGFRWLHESIGTNWRMMEMQATIGRIQLKRMQSWHQARIDNAKHILSTAEQFSSLFRVELPSADNEHAYYKCYFYVRPDGLAKGWTRDRIVQEITDRGVPCFSGSCPEVYLEKAFDETGFQPAERLPVAKELGETSLMFLVHPTLTTEEIQKICDVIAEVAKLASD